MKTPDFDQMWIDQKISQYKMYLSKVEEFKSILADLRPDIAATLAKYRPGDIVRVIDGRKVKDCKVVWIDYRPEEVADGQDPVLYKVHPVKTNGQLSVRLKPFILRPYHKIKEL